MLRSSRACARLLQHLEAEERAIDHGRHDPSVDDALGRPVTWLALDQAAHWSPHVWTNSTVTSTITGRLLRLAPQAKQPRAVMFFAGPRIDSRLELEPDEARRACRGPS